MIFITLRNLPCALTEMAGSGGSGASSLPPFPFPPPPAFPPFPFEAGGFFFCGLAAAFGCGDGSLSAAGVFVGA